AIDPAANTDLSPALFGWTIQTALSGLSTTAGPLSPSFSSARSVYTAGPVANTRTSVTVTATAAAAGSTLQVRVNGGGFVSVASGRPSGPLTLLVGANAIEVRVTAAGRTTSYTIGVTRRAGPGGSGG